MTIIKTTTLAIAAAASLGFFAMTSQPALAGGGHGGGHGKHGGGHGHGKHGGWHGGHGHHGHHGHGHRRHFGHAGFYGYGYASPCVVTYGPYGPMQVCY